MNRFSFLRNLLGATLLPTVALARTTPIAAPVDNLHTEASRLRHELLDAWAASERMTLTTAGQMPANGFGFQYTPEAMTFDQQWRHCCVFTTAQIAARFPVTDPYVARILPSNLTKEQALAELKVMYAFVRQAITTAPDERLLADDDYVGDTMPNWRFLYALENHIIHHRGQCMVYLRLKGITPVGYLGW